MSTKKTSKSKTAKNASAVQIKKDAKGRLWGVPKDGAEQGPYANRKEALDAKAGAPKPEKPSKAKKAKPPKGKKLSAIDAAAQVLARIATAESCPQLLFAQTRSLRLGAINVENCPHETD